MRKLNRTLFDNNQVLSFVNGGLSINTDLIPAGLHPVTMVMVQSAYSPMAQVTVIDSGYQAPGVIVVSTQPSQPTGQVVSVSAAVPVGAPITVQPVAEPVGMQSMAIEQRSMRWNLPSSIHVGQVLTIVDPDGRPMKVPSPPPLSHHSLTTNKRTQFTVEAHHKPGEEIILPY